MSGIDAVAAQIVGLSSVVIEKRAPARRHAPITAAGMEPGLVPLAERAHGTPQRFRGRSLLPAR